MKAPSKMNKSELAADNKALIKLLAQYREVFVFVECLLEDMEDARDNMDKVTHGAEEVRDAELRRAEQR